MNKLWFEKKSGVHGNGLFASQNIEKGLKILNILEIKSQKEKVIDKRISN